MNKLKELSAFLVCIAAILGLAYYSGILKGFAPKDFQNAFNDLGSTISGNVKSSGAAKYLATNPEDRVSAAVYKSYRPMIIPANVLKGSETSRSWTNIFNSNKKVVFYLYDDSDNFNSEIISYANRNKLGKYYDFQQYSRKGFAHYNMGGTGPSKICNSLQECNEMREKASNYSLLVNFLEQCGKTMCVVSPYKKQYLILKRRNASEANQLLEGVKLW